MMKVPRTRVEFNRETAPRVNTRPSADATSRIFSKSFKIRTLLYSSRFYRCLE